MSQVERINLDAPQFDQSNFYGRFSHFLRITDCRLLLKSDAEFNKAKDLLQKYRLKQEATGTTAEEVWKAKYLYESAFHPDTGEKQNIFGRMSCQVPGGMLITGAMLSFYKTNTAVVFWQWLNQSFNALVNYTNRNANSPLTVMQMGFAYVTATSTALLTAIGLKMYLASRSSNLLQRFVPFAAVASANCTNIPLMRQVELTGGVALYDDCGNKLAFSKFAAAKGISQVVFSRTLMAAPGMTVLPFIVEALEKRGKLRNPHISALFQTLAVGIFLSFMTPASCAIFNQKCSVSTSSLERFEPAVFREVKVNSTGHNIPALLYFNKGL